MSLWNTNLRRPICSLASVVSRLTCKHTHTQHHLCFSVTNYTDRHKNSQQPNTKRHRTQYFKKKQRAGRRNKINEIQFIKVRCRMSATQCSHTNTHSTCTEWTDNKKWLWTVTINISTTEKQIRFRVPAPVWVWVSNAESIYCFWVARQETPLAPIAFPKPYPGSWNLILCLLATLLSLIWCIADNQMDRRIDWNR